MFDTILHILGLCPDSLGHFNLASLANIPMHEASHIVKSLKSRLWKISKTISYWK